MGPRKKSRASVERVEHRATAGKKARGEALVEARAGGSRLRVTHRPSVCLPVAPGAAPMAIGAAAPQSQAHTLCSVNEQMNEKNAAWAAAWRSHSVPCDALLIVSTTTKHELYLSWNEARITTSSSSNSSESSESDSIVRPRQSTADDDDAIAALLVRVDGT